jgi:hypothetical protein
VAGEILTPNGTGAYGSYDLVYRFIKIYPN